MKIYLETTEWKDSTPNHSYILSDDKRSCVGYIKVGSKDPIMFSKPMNFDPRYRAFKPVGEFVNPNKEYTQYVGHGDYQTVKEYKVKGSKNDEYTVTISEVTGNSCTCAGFTFRRKCKHIEQVLNA
jgi:hypothetical protein